MERCVVHTNLEILRNQVRLTCPNVLVAFASECVVRAPVLIVYSATSFFAMVEEAKELLALPLQVSEALKQAQEQFNVVVLLFKTFEKAKLEPAKLKSFVWTLYILARGTARPRNREVPFVFESVSKPASASFQFGNRFVGFPLTLWCTCRCPCS